jgi:hypothetical protein
MLPPSSGSKYKPRKKTEQDGLESRTSCSGHDEETDWNGESPAGARAHEEVKNEEKPLMRVPTQPLPSPKIFCRMLSVRDNSADQIS